MPHMEMESSHTEQQRSVEVMGLHSWVSERPDVERSSGMSPHAVERTKATAGSTATA